MAVENNVLTNFIDSIQPQQAERKANAHQAIVSHVDNEGVVWVYVAGNETATPTESTSAEVKRGDEVTVEWRNNKLYIAGNHSDPSAGTKRVANVERIANDAVNIADAAVQTAESINQYFWHKVSGTDAGAHITQIPKDQFEQSPSGGNTLITSDGMVVRDGTDKLASFGYYNNYASMGFGEPNSYGNPMSAVMGSVDETNDVTEIAVNVLSTEDSQHSGLAQFFAQVEDGRSTAYLATHNDISTSSGRVVVQTDVDGSVVSFDADKITFPNAFEVTRNGHIEAPTETVSLTITASTGTLVSYTAYQFGKIVFMTIAVRKTSSTASGANIFTGTISETAYRPKAIVTGASYYDAHAISAQINTSGAIVFRNASPSAVTIGSSYSVAVSFTYMID